MAEYDTVEWDAMLKEKKLDFILTEAQLSDIVQKLGHTIDEDGYVIVKETGERVLSIDEDEIRVGDLAAILPGSAVLLRKNIASFSQYLAERGL